jgi:uncharacterized low-complexity protein
MSKRTTINSISLAVGTAFVAGMATAPAVQADVNPFAATALTSGYMVAEKGAEGNCGARKPVTEAECGANKAAEKVKEAECGANKAEPKPIKEAKCGEAKCGENK